MTESASNPDASSSLQAWNQRIVQLPEFTIPSHWVTVYGDETNVPPAIKAVLSDEELAMLLQNDVMVEQMGTTHAQLGGFLQRFKEAEAASVRQAIRTSCMTGLIGYGRTPIALENGAAYVLSANTYLGMFKSRFGEDPPVSSDKEFHLTSLQDGSTLAFNGLTGYLAGAYGVYGEHHGPSPEAIARMAGIIGPGYGDDDPVIAVASGRLTSVTIATEDQKTRFQNLLNADHPLARGAQVTSAGPPGSA